MTERALRNAVLKAASAMGARLFRNVTAQGWAGKSTRIGDDVLVMSAYPLHAGLCVGSSDLIGFDCTGRFVAIELKTGRVAVTPEQAQFLSAVRSAGGLAGVARSVDDAVGILTGQPRAGSNR